MFGSIDAIEDERLVIDSPLLGTQSVATDLVRRIFRWSGGKAQLFNGPGQLDSWKNKSDRDGWSGVGGQIATKKSLTSLYRDVGLSQRCRIELEVSWEKKPNFVISIGTDETAKSATEAYRIEFWGSAIVMLREWSTPTRDHHSAHSNGGDDGRDLQPSRTIRCMTTMTVTNHDHHGVIDRDGRDP